MEVKEITLLDLDTVKLLPVEIRACMPSKNYEKNFDCLFTDLLDNGQCDWWTRSKGTVKDYVASVIFNGGISIYGMYPEDEATSVRPALIVDDLSNIELYDEIELFGETWIKINENTLLCKYAICNYVFSFSSDNNDYETSDVKVYLQRWAENKNIFKKGE